MESYFQKHSEDYFNIRNDFYNIGVNSVSTDGESIYIDADVLSKKDMKNIDKICEDHHLNYVLRSDFFSIQIELTVKGTHRK